MVTVKGIFIIIAVIAYIQLMDKLHQTIDIEYCCYIICHNDLNISMNFNKYLLIRSTSKRGGLSRR